MDRRIADIMFKVSKVLQKLTDRVKLLENIAHPPRKFVRCEECETKIREKK